MTSSFSEKGIIFGILLPTKEQRKKGNVWKEKTPGEIPANLTMLLSRKQ